MPRLLRFTGAVAVALAAACSEPTAPARAPEAAPDQAPQMVISDATQPGGTPHFFFLPPVARHIPAPTGQFDATLAPRVEICELSGGVCGAQIEQFETVGLLHEGVHVYPLLQTYAVTFFSGRYHLSTSKVYRIGVFVGAQQLGFADLKVVRGGREDSWIDQDGYVVIRNGWPLPITFRIEKGIAASLVVTPAADTVAVGQTAQFTASVNDLHGNPLPSAAVNWSSSNPAVATVDANGLATGVSVGTATITASVGAVTGSATLVVQTANHSPVAVSDTFQAIGNVTIPVAAPGVLGNDSDPDGNPLSAVAGTFTTEQGGTLTVSADGSLSYLSAPGFTGVDSAPYVVTDGQAADTAQVVFQVASRVWYVRNTATAPGDGRDASPFATLAQAEAASAPGETIFVLFGNVSTSGLDSGITLKNGQSLIGQGISSPVVASVNGAPLVLLASGMAPTIGRSSAGTAVQVAVGNTIRGVGIASSNGAAVAGSGFGTLTVSEVAIGAAGGAGMDLQNGTLAVSLGNLSSTGSSGAGLRLASVSGSFTASGGSISGAAGAGVEVAGGDADVSYAGSVTAGAGRSVSVTGRSGGTVDLSGNLTDNAGGILVQGNTGGSIQFSGGSKSLSTGAATAVTLSGNGGATIRFGGGGLAIATTTGGGFAASGGGTVIVTGAHNSIASAGGVALSVQGTTIGAGGLTFESISADGGANGIVLSGTGSVSGLLVTGNGAAGSGGTIRGSTGADGSTAGVGVYLSNTQAPELRFMQINDHGNFAIFGSNVNGFTLAGSVVNGANGDNAGLLEGGIAFTQLTGSASVSSSAISGGLTDNLRVVNTSGVLDRLSISGTTFGLNGSADGRDGVHLEAKNGAVLKATVAGSAFNGARANLLLLDLQNSAASDVVIQNNTFRNAHPAISSGAGGVVLQSTGLGTPSLTYAVTGNSFQGALGAALGVALNGGTGSFSGSIVNNQVGASGVANSGSVQGSGISLTSVGGGVHTVLVSGNQIRQYNNMGVLLQIGDASQGGNGQLNATVTNNVVAEPGSAAIPKNGIHLNAGTVTGDAHQVCLDMSGNSITGSGSGGAAGTDFRFRQRMLTTVRLPGYAGANNDNAAVQAFEQANNPPSPTGLVQNTVSTGGGGFVGGASCAQP